MSTLPSALIVENRESARGNWAYLTLNLEKSLNALNQEMIEAAIPLLEKWEKDPKVVGVVLQGAGEKAFCAGGDIRMLYEAMKTAPEGQVLAGASRFFRSEYTLDYLIHRFEKPILCLGHGIVMGGGLGLFAGASHRVLSEKSLLAMPEITIGLYPDVGASWFLNRMPPGVGLYLGLTGTRLRAGDCLFLGLGDYFIERAKHPQVLEDVLAESWSEEPAANHRQLAKLLKQHISKSPPSELRERLDLIRELVDCESAEEIWQSFESYTGSDEWILAGKKALLGGSPTSACVIFEQLRRSKHLSLKECFEMEYHMSNQFARHPDFREGVRALLIDKDLKPQWTPRTIQEVRPEYVEAHFKAL